MKLNPKDEYVILADMIDWAAVAAGRKLRDLVFELSLADANEIASSESPLKKNSRSSS